ncbi:queuosine precursor transporter [Limnobacter humi]|uniref:Probable queuosine precursor transporter n=1 Tax=Limnobacter humi TaxID=1778671 RepID=A0ABT1WGJ6_9BURK|nr:queuosine precursor transporter [Limnobacter humi]MCQ8896151.1 queuosine precursor transporter [Limnobacter humi]
MTAPSTAATLPRQYKYYDFILVAFVVVLLCSNLIGPAKIAQVDLPWVGSVTFGAGVLFFPISYLFSDILTEVYGYSRDRRAVWSGFGALVFASAMAFVVVNLPPAPFWADRQPAIETVFGNTWRIVLASLIAFWSGSFANSFVLAKLKLLTQGRWLWTRTIGSTLVGELIDSALFYTIAFWGIMTTDQLITVTLTQYVVKTGWEVVATPLTYWVVSSLKKAENEDYYDRNTRFTPFSLKV